MSGSWPKVLCDPVHKLIAFEDNPCDRLLLELINTPEMQRLRRIKQMGLTETVFPGATHSRFAHSLGVLHVARLFLDQFQHVQGQPLPQEERTFILCAALLHDIGHGPFSHVFELVTGQWHESFTRAIIHNDQTEVHRRLRAHDRTMPERLARFFDEEGEERPSVGIPPYLAQVVSGQLDADRCDYLLRDSHATGTNYGLFDLPWLLAQLRPDPSGRRFYLTRKGLSAAETYLFARYHMYRTVYFHKTSRSAEVMLKLLFRRFKELIGNDGIVRDVNPGLIEAFTGQMSLTRYLEFDDHTITELFKACLASGDEVLVRLADGLLNRRLYKAIDVTAQAAAQDWSRILAFDARVRERMQQCGLDPRYCFAEDSASDTPYEPYQPDVEKPARQIYVENGAGQIVEISTLSDALVQLRKTYTVLRYYVPAEFRDELRRIAAETLRER